MTLATSALPKAFGVWFRQLDRFDPASFHGVNWRWPKRTMTPIGSVLHVRKDKADQARFRFADLQPITIHFDGSIDRRAVDSNREYSMDLFFARPGDVVVAKIDLKNGAVGIVPDWSNVVVTGHFAVYEPDHSRLVPEYLIRLVQASFFKNYLWRNKVGAEGRKEVKLEFFESIEIPLPPLTTQRAIVARWEQARAERAAAEERVQRLEAVIEVRFFRDLGLKAPAQAQRPKTFGVSWRDFARWSVSYSQSAQSGTDIARGKYPVVELGSILEMLQYGTSEKANDKGGGVPVLRINNIKRRMLDVSDLKHIPLSKKTRASLLLKDGDILIIRTSGSRDLVGTCAVFHEQEEYFFASYLIRLRASSNKANPDFVSLFVNSELGRQQVNAISRQIMQNNINSEELRSLRIPLPPLEIQREIVNRVQAGRAEVARVREEAARRAQEAEVEVEAMILGVKAT